jgi:hypothetical protein
MKITVRYLARDQYGNIYSIDHEIEAKSISQRRLRAEVNRTFAKVPTAFDPSIEITEIFP